jgi:hypothetical protein
VVYLLLITLSPSIAYVESRIVGACADLAKVNITSCCFPYRLAVLDFKRPDYSWGCTLAVGINAADAYALRIRAVLNASLESLCSPKYGSYPNSHLAVEFKQSADLPEQLFSPQFVCKSSEFANDA